MSPRDLHRALDVLLAQYLAEHADDPEALPSKISVLTLAQWSHTRCCNEIWQRPDCPAKDRPS